MSVAAGALDVYRLRKSYGHNTIVDDVSFVVPKGALLTLLGPSGCGKSTLLRIIAGFVDAGAGLVRINGRDVTRLPPDRRPTAMVFQSYALFPHMTVFQNIGFGLRLRRQERGAMRTKIGHALDLVRMSSFADRYPSELSGGQQQRVALARCLVIEPEVLLLDEPFGALDRHLREEMQLELRKLQRLLNITMLVVTHDQQEALVLSDYVAVMNQGRIEQLAAPAAVYDKPATRFVAAFMGIPNILSGVVTQTECGPRFETASGKPIAIAESGFAPSGTGHCLALRPETLALAAPDDERATFVGVVTFTSLVGSMVNCEVKVGSDVLKIVVPRNATALAIGESVGIAVDPDHVVLIPT
ncbi:ABC transporter ATP-binding protein [Lichenihabitans psoromatis]|uniref:ABC transporter ATP-binding protein n=1 Tax=Lichenihabitans psoromatis TaxID=2528642 RepID=UPI001038521B|nr:ABC transporter ATP-binding protein [Lichenihabitans psoromatis]